MRSLAVGKRVRRAVAALAALACIAPAAALDPVSGAVDDAVRSAVEERIAEQAGYRTATAIEEQVAAKVAESAAASVADGVAGAVAQQVGEAVAGQAADALTAQLAPPLGRVPGGLGGAIERAGDRVTDLGEDASRTLDDARETTRETVDGALETTSAVARPFVADVDAAGRPIEQGVLVLLVPAGDLEAIRGLGITVRRARPLAGLGRVLVRLELDAGISPAQALRRVRTASAAAIVDHNHLYTLEAEAAEAPPSAPPARQDDAATVTPAAEAGGLVIGQIDTAVALAHPALAQLRIEQRDFTATELPRPTAHGTAIASVIAAEALRGSAARPVLYAAGVFFERAPGIATATSEGLVEAVAWLLEQRVPVINMSLTGPPNELLHLALQRAATLGTQVVAAIGNSGPLGGPLYPAAYATVIAVTAVDAADRVFASANRGRHVMFAAPGVEVRVADERGGYIAQTGTSLASAYAAVAIAAALERARRERIDPAQVLQRLRTDARDLGPPGFDEIYGYGRIVAKDS